MYLSAGEKSNCTEAHRWIKELVEVKETDQIPSLISQGGTQTGLQTKLDGISAYNLLQR